MTPEKIALVQSSFQSVIPIAETAADLFYGRLFEIAPQVRPLFPEDMSGQKSKLMSMLATAITNLHQVETILPAVQRLARAHVAYGAVPDHYPVVGAALLWTLEQGLGDAFTPAVKDAWTDAYRLLSSAMIDAAKDVPAA